MASLKGMHWRRHFFEGKYAELEEQLFANYRDVFPSEVYTLDGFLWAVATVRSRVHSPLDGDDVALVPLADLVRLDPSNSTYEFHLHSMIPTLSACEWLTGSIRRKVKPTQTSFA